VASQTPTKLDGDSGLDAYRLSWLTANALLRDGYSWSGNERNVAYLNLASMPMANVSGVAGLDLIDDARALALADWDGDGDLDIWMTQRTGPSARLLLNQSRNAHRSIQLRLLTNSGNRDAIGARVTLHLGGNNRYQTARAGSGYLSQSSKWLHFGLGNYDGPLQATVIWPNGQHERFDNFSNRGKYVLKQGTGKALRKPDRDVTVSLSAAELPCTEVTSQARIVPYSQIPFPRMVLKNKEGGQVVLGMPASAPTLMLLWASWCNSCAVEMKLLAASQNEIKKSGLNIVAVSMDGLDQTKTDATDQTDRFLRRLRFPYASFPGDQSVIDQLEVLHRSLVDTHLPLPLPASVLLDRHGRIAAIYRGPVDVTTLLNDVQQLTRKDERPVSASIPFDGSDLSLAPPEAMDPIQVALTFYQGDHSVHARNYMRQLIQIAETKAIGHETLNRGELHYFFATLLEESAQVKGAVHAYKYALSVNPEKWEAHRNLARLYYQQDQWRDALPHFQKSVQFEHANINFRLEFASTAFRLGLPSITREQLLEILKLDPDHEMANRILQRLKEIEKKSPDGNLKTP
jgi:peroxiredoxin